MLRVKLEPTSAALMLLEQEDGQNTLVFQVDNVFPARLSAYSNRPLGHVEE